jgi:hypothetical protein
LATPGWESYLANELARLSNEVHASSGAEKEYLLIQESIKRLESAQPVDEAKLRAAVAARNAALEQIRKGSGAQIEFNALIRVAGALADRRIVGIIAPYLFSESQVIDLGDASIPSLEQAVAGELYNMKLRGMDTPDIPDTSYDELKWKVWWTQHQALYAPPK